MPWFFFREFNIESLIGSFKGSVENTTWDLLQDPRKFCRWGRNTHRRYDRNQLQVIPTLPTPIKWDPRMSITLLSSTIGSVEFSLCTRRPWHSDSQMSKKRSTSRQRYEISDLVCIFFSVLCRPRYANSPLLCEHLTLFLGNSSQLACKSRFKDAVSREVG